jgi:WD40 repeat protein
MLRLLAALLLSLLALPLSAQTDSWLPDDLEVITPKNVTELEEIAHIGRGAITFWQWSPDRSQIVFATPLGIFFHDLNGDFRTTLELPNHEGEIESFFWNPDGSRLYTIHLTLSYYNERSTETLYVTDLTDDSPRPHPLRRFSVPTELYIDYGDAVYYWGSSHEISADGQLLLVRTIEKYFAPAPTYLVDAETGEQLAIITFQDGGSVEFSEDGSQLIMDLGETLQVWNVHDVIRQGEVIVSEDQLPAPYTVVPQATRTPPDENDSHPSEVRCTDDQPHDLNAGDPLCAESELIIRDPATGNLLAQWMLPYHITFFRVIPNYGRVVAQECVWVKVRETYESCGSVSLHLLDLTTGEEIARLPLAIMDPFNWTVMPDSGSIITFDDFVQVWDLNHFEQIHTFSEYSDLFAFAWNYPYPTLSYNGTQIVSASETAVALWSAIDGQLQAILPFGVEVTSVDISRDGTQIAASGNKQSVVVWQIPDEILERDQSAILNNPQILNRDTDASWNIFSPIDFIHFSPDGSWLAASNGRYGLWDLTTQPATPISSANGWLGFDDNEIVQVLQEETVRWDADIVHAHSALVADAFIGTEPSQRHWKETSGYPGMYSIDTANRDGDKVHIDFSIPAPLGSPNMVSPNLTLFATNAYNGGQTPFVTFFYDVSTGVRIHLLREGAAFAFSPDGRILYTTDGDRITLWGVSSD